MNIQQVKEELQKLGAKTTGTKKQLDRRFLLWKEKKLDEGLFQVQPMKLINPQPFPIDNYKPLIDFKGQIIMTYKSIDEYFEVNLAKKGKEKGRILAIKLFIKCTKVAVKDCKYFILSRCCAEQKKTVEYDLKIIITQNSCKVVQASCSCPAGSGFFAACKHMGALCYSLEYFSISGTSTWCHTYQNECEAGPGTRNGIRFGCNEHDYCLENNLDVFMDARYVEYGLETEEEARLCYEKSTTYEVFQIGLIVPNKHRQEKNSAELVLHCSYLEITECGVILKKNTCTMLKSSLKVIPNIDISASFVPLIYTSRIHTLLSQKYCSSKSSRSYTCHFKKSFSRHSSFIQSLSKFVSLEATLRDLPPGRAPPVYVIQGKMYHHISNININAQRERYGPIYFLDTEASVDQRHDNNQTLDRNLIARLEYLFREINPYARAYMHLRE
ncbi:hypothetical protein NQ315_017225 [Exocentrus adspersus]|uniref:SWIM-type domain-containing protein n=1 Tax=Exocentrus adspersus TaxID=1586481 RepID=A0AAV8V6Y0_9CUCU|nr:hypothetical protein NQ315_017225 [Exocentrus adspersus]